MTRVFLGFGETGHNPALSSVTRVDGRPPLGRPPGAWVVDTALHGRPVWLRSVRATPCIKPVYNV